MDITSYLNSLEDCREALIRFRRDLHRHPEPGWKEFYTTARLIAALKDHGIPVRYGKEILHRDLSLGLSSPEGAGRMHGACRKPGSGRRYH